MVTIKTPEYEELTYRDFSIQFVSGQVATLVLRPDDVLKIGKTTFTLTIARTGQKNTWYRDKIEGYALRSFIYKKKVGRPIPPDTISE